MVVYSSINLSMHPSIHLSTCLFCEERQTDRAVYRTTDGWMDEGMNRQIDGSIKGRMEGWINRHTDRQVERSVGGRMDGWTDELINQ